MKKLLARTLLCSIGPCASSLTILTLAQTLTVPVQAQASDAKHRFESASREATKLADRGHWKAAKEAWLACLRTHAGAKFVRSSLPDIREALKTASFWAVTERPEIDSLVTGKVHAFDRSSGRVRISYDMAGLSEFEDRGGALIHPLQMKGEYSITLEGPPSKLPQIFVALEGADSFIVVLGDHVEGAFLYSKHQLVHVQDGRSTPLAEKEPRVRKKGETKTAQVKVTVGRNRIRVSFNGRRILAAKREDGGGFGHWGVGKDRNSSFDKLTLSGDAETAWLDGRLDAAVQAKRAAFEASYEAPTELDAWPAAALRPTPRNLKDLASQIEIPGRIPLSKADLLARASQLVGEPITDSTFEELEGLRDRGLPDVTVDFLTAMAHIGRDRPRVALGHLEKALGEKPKPALRRLYSLALMGGERLGRAQLVIEDLIEEEPNDPDLHADLARINLRRGQPEKARAALDRGLAIAPTAEDLLAVRDQVVKALQGPPWKRTFQAESERFVVTSDIDPRICRVAAREMDATLTRYEDRFGTLPSNLKKTRVYIFSGEASYKAYVQGIARHGHENTAGIYSTLTKQILCWNVSDRDDLMRVLRHETMHRYMDLTLGLTPRWLDEGMAEFMAVSRVGRREWEEGLAHETYLSVLKRYGWKTIPLERYIYLDDVKFMEHADLNYATAWSLIRFLRSHEEYTEILDELWSYLQSLTDSNTALDRTFRDVDLAELSSAFAKYVQDLRREAR